MFQSFCRLEPAQKLSNPVGLATDDNDFQAIVVVQMDMLSRNDDGSEIVLDIGQLLYDSRSMVVVDEGNGAGDGLVG